MKRGAWCALALLAGCGTTEVPLAYVPSAPLPSPNRKPVLAMRVVIDARAIDRRDQDPRWIGIAQGDLGTPNRKLATTSQAVNLVDGAFRSAMLGRGLLAPVGAQAFDLTVRVVRLDGSQRLGLSGRADFALTVARHDSGRVVYQDEVRAQVDGSSLPSFDTLAFVPTADVAAATNAAMSQAIDEALDKPALRSAING